MTLFIHDAWRRGLIVGCSLLLFSGCVAQQADVARMKRDLDAKISKLDKSKVELQQAVSDAEEALRHANSIIAQQRAEIKELLHSRAEVMDQVATLKEGDLSEVRGHIDTNSHSLQTMVEQVETINEKMESFEKEFAIRDEAIQPTLKNIQARVGQQEGVTEVQIAKDEEFRSSLLDYQRVLSSLREAFNQQEMQVKQAQSRISELSGRRERDSQQASDNMAEVKRSIGSVVSALEKVSNSLTHRLDDQESQLARLGQAVQRREVRQADIATPSISSRTLEHKEIAKSPPLSELTRHVPADSRPSGISNPSTISEQKQPETVRSQDSEMIRYRKYFTNLRDGDLNNALQGFTKFLQDYPESPLAANAQYWLGECYYGQRLFDQAIREFEHVFTLYPSSQKAPAALLKIGYSHLELQDSGTARAIFRQIVRIYPKSPEATKAYARLTEVGDSSKRSS